MCEMKNSGIEWIGEMPASWEIKRIKNLFHIIGGNGFPDILQGKDCGDYPFCKVSDINGTSKFVSTATNYVTEEIVKANRFNIVPVNSIIFAKIGAALQKNHRKINTIPCCIDNNTEALVPFNSALVNYYYYLLKTIDMNWFDNKSTIPSINNQRLLAFSVPIPPENKQYAIASLLDKKSSQVDALIANVQTQIEKLRLYKQSVITDAVTKGLDPSVQMKDSEVEWIGEIPINWDVVPINAMFKIKKDIIGHEPDCVLSITQQGLRVKDISVNEGQMAANYDKYQIVNVGDFAMNHMDLLTGGVGISEYDGVTSPDYRVFVIRNTDMNPRFFLYIFEMYYRNRIFYAFGQGAANVGRWRLPAQNFKTTYIPVAPINEQTAIVEYLDERMAQIDQLIAVKQKKIEKLEQYKKSLIYEYVTGKKEVS